jgi:hypothetical protein
MRYAVMPLSLAGTKSSHGRAKARNASLPELPAIQVFSSPSTADARYKASMTKMDVV